MSKEKKNHKKSKVSKGAKLYFSACLLSLGIGIFSLCLAGNITRSALDLSERTITIPSYDEIIKNNEKDSELKKEEHIDTIGELKEIQDINKETEGIEKAVKVSNNTAEEDEKAITFTAPCEGDIIKIFSIDKPLKSKTMGDFRTHNGIDIKSDLGSSVYASADGVVDKIYDDNLLGITVLLAHSETLKTEYSNIAGADMVKEGQEVKKGQAIGCVGNSAKGEFLDDAHLHFAVIENGIYVNPEKYIDF